MPIGEIDECVTVKYYVESPLDVSKVAKAIAEVQSIGMGGMHEPDSERIVARHGARVLDVTPLRGRLECQLPVRTVIDRDSIEAAEITIAYPSVNFKSTIPNLLTAVAGELFEMNMITAAKVTDIVFPESFLRDFSGPRFGIGGCRELLGIFGRPIIGGIVKPCVGLTAERVAALAEEGFNGGLDFIKDDELLADAPYNSVRDRVAAVMASIRRVEERTGEKKMYAFNITDRLDRLRELHDIVVDGGGRCVMLNAATIGIEAMREFAEYCKVPIHCHRTFAAVWARSPLLGLSFPVLTKLFRICGADQIHCGAVQGKLYETDDEVLSNMRACTSSLASMRSSLPVSSGGQWAGTVPANAEKIGHNDFIHLAGAGTFLHPDGPAAGARSLRQAWDAVLQCIPLHEYAKDHRELSRALDFFAR